jgi:hypothetical protein
MLAQSFFKGRPPRPETAAAAADLHLIVTGGNDSTMG